MTTLNYLFSLLLVGLCLISLPSSLAADTDKLFVKYHIHIMNDLPTEFPSLYVHCRSKDNNFDPVFLFPHQEFKFVCKVNLWRTTLFYCEVKWGEKELDMDAFKASRDEDRCLEHGYCLWSARPDGIYFSRDNTTWYNAYPW